MSLKDYEIKNDHFEPEETRAGFGFPCNACIHRKKDQYEEPCRTCGYNLNAINTSDNKIQAQKNARVS